MSCGQVDCDAKWKSVRVIYYIIHILARPLASRALQNDSSESRLRYRFNIFKFMLMKCDSSVYGCNYVKTSQRAIFGSFDKHFYSFCVPPDSRFSLEETSRLDGVTTYMPKIFDSTANSDIFLTRSGVFN